MKIDRRSFLGLGLGAVAGAAVSPVGPKLTDDLSIWTQNWPWTPVPKDGNVSFDSSVCSLCPGNCGISVREINGRPVKIEGRKDHPLNQGGICLHGLSGLQYLYGPDRIRSPLKKSGDKFEEISWKEAIDLVSGKLAALRDKNAAQSLACISGHNQGTVPGLFKRFLKVFGSNHFYSVPSMDTTWEIIASKMHGRRTSMGFDLENADFVLSFSAGILEGWGSPVYSFRASASRKSRGGRLYQIEPRLSKTAAAADRWIPANPGSEADLALGICSVIITEERYDSLSALFFDADFKAFSELVTGKYTPEAVAEKTGLAADTIKQIARDFTKAYKPVAIAGRGRGNRAGDLREFAAVHALNCLAGNINKKGGVWINKGDNYYNFPVEKLDAAAKKGLSKKNYENMDKFVDHLASSAGSPVEVLFVYGANPYYTLHDSEKAAKALDKIPFKVSFASFMDETAQAADVILPGHFFLERLEDVPPRGGVAPQVVGLTEPVIDPVYDTKNPGDAVLLIAKSLSGNIADNFPWKNYEKCLESVTGDFWDPLSDEGYAALNKGGQNETAKIDFSFPAEDVKATGLEGNQGDFPLILLPVDKVRLIGGAAASSPFAVKTVSDDVIKGKDQLVEMNPETAKEMNIGEGDRIRITTPVGTAAVKAHLFEGIMPGLIGMAEGLGHSLIGNGYISGKGVNVNRLVGPVFDSDSGQDAAWGIRAKISKA